MKLADWMLERLVYQPRCELREKHHCIGPIFDQETDFGPVPMCLVAGLSFERLGELLFKSRWEVTLSEPAEYHAHRCALL